jgi:hypothetical protein
MFEELAARTGASWWTIASMLFFVTVWAGVAAWATRARAEDMDARARLPLDGDR